jgi:hypothetical protein
MAAIRTLGDLEKFGAEPFGGGGNLAACMSANNPAALPLPDITLVPATGWTAVQSSDAFDPAAGVYTAPSTGFYQVCASVSIDPSGQTIPAGSGCSVFVELSTDDGGSWSPIAFGRVVYQADSNAPSFPSASIGYKLNAGDLVRVSAAQADGGGLTLALVGGTFSVALVATAA